MSVTRVANRYAKSLVQMASEQNSLDEIHKEVQALRQLIEDSKDLAMLFRSPVIKVQKKAAIVRKFFDGKVSDTTMHFLEMVIGKGREKVLPEILDAFVAGYNHTKGITPVTLTTAVAVDDDFRNAVISILQQDFGLSTVELSQQVDEELIGGLVLEFNHNRYDASISHQLERLRHTLLKAN